MLYNKHKKVIKNGNNNSSQRRKADGTLNYYSCEDSDVKVRIEEDEVFLTDKSRVNPAVFGGGRQTWSLRIDIDWKKEEGT